MFGFLFKLLRLPAPFGEQLFEGVAPEAQAAVAGGEVDVGGARAAEAVGEVVAAELLDGVEEGEARCAPPGRRGGR